MSKNNEKAAVESKVSPLKTLSERVKRLEQRTEFFSPVNFRTLIEEIISELNSETSKSDYQLELQTDKESTKWPAIYAINLLGKYVEEGEYCILMFNVLNANTSADRKEWTKNAIKNAK